MFTQLGRRAAAHRTSSGKVIIASLPRPERERLLEDLILDRATEFTITDPAELREELALTLRRGYAENRQESELGVVSVAAPIRDATGHAVAALSLAGPSERMEEKKETYAEAVMLLARTVSTQMGWRGAKP